MKQSDNYDVKYQQILKIYFIVYVIMLAEVSYLYLLKLSLTSINRLDMFLKNPYVFIDEDGQRKKRNIYSKW